MTPYPDQLTAVARAIKIHRGSIEMPTGAGKSITMALLIHELQVKTLVIVPTLELKRQLSNSFTAYFGNLENITIENIDSPRLEKLDNYDLLIVDECHRAASLTYRRLNKTVWNKIYYRYFFSATCFRNNEEEQLLFEGIAGEVIYKLSYEDAVKEKYIVPIEAYYLDVPKQKVTSDGWKAVYNELVVKNTPRNHLIAKLLTSFHSSQKNTLCLVKEINHGKILVELTGFPFCSGEDEESRKYIQRFNSGAMKVLIATEGMMGEGIDTKPCEYVVITGLGKAKSALMQKIGRSVRTYPGKESGKVILFKDTSHKYCLTHFRKQVKIVKDEYGAKVTKLEGL